MKKRFLVKSLACSIQIYLRRTPQLVFSLELHHILIFILKFRADPLVIFLKMTYTLIRKCIVIGNGKTFLLLCIFFITMI